jgi:SNF family Na+-dependent transporter
MITSTQPTSKGQFEASLQFFQSTIFPKAPIHGVQSEATFQSNLIESLEVNYVLLASFALTWIILYFAEAKQLINKPKLVWAFFLTFLLFLAGLVLCSFYKGQFSKGLPFLFNLEYEFLWNAKIWVSALEQALLQFMLGFGLYATFASFRSKKSSILKPAFLAPFLNILVSLLLSGVIFGYLKEVADDYGCEIPKLSLKTMEVFYVPLLAILNAMPYGNILVAFFFGILFVLGIFLSVRSLTLTTI